MSLQLNGFRSYPHTVTVDFTGKTLAAALGDTGAGKSSLLDAIVFALFRKSSWDARDLRQLIADGVTAMSVSFIFLHDGHRWRVDRTMHATNANGGRHHLTNLDTGEEVDGAVAVDARVKAVLQMGWETFLRVVLLPQGQFDRLLTAAGKERTSRLRELFGADALATIREGALRQSGRLGQLLIQAQAQRNAMPDDPAQAAHEADAAADAAEAAEARLSMAINIMIELRKVVSTASASLASTDSAALALAKRVVPDAVSILDSLGPIADDLAARRESMDRRVETVGAMETELEESLRSAEARGEGRDALVRAAAIVEKLAAQADMHRSERTRLDVLGKELTAESTAIAIAGEELVLREKQVKPRAVAAEKAVTVNKQLQNHGSSVRTLVGLAAEAAQRVSQGIDAVRTAEGERDTALTTVDPLSEKLDLAGRNVHAAEKRLELIQLRDLAASVAAEAHPGDDCPVCQCRLAADFKPGGGASAAELDEAKGAVKRTKESQSEAVSDLALARAAVTAAKNAVTDRVASRQEVERDARWAVEEAERAIADFASLAERAGGVFDAETTSTILVAAAAELAVQPLDAAPTPKSLTEPILAALTVCEATVASRADALRADAAHEDATLKAERSALTSRSRTHDATVTVAEKASTRHASAVSSTTGEIHTLPARIQELLPDNAIDVQPNATDSAAEVIANQLREVNEVHNGLNAAYKEKSKILDDQRALDREEQTTVDKPLSALRRRLERWRDTAAESVAHITASNRLEAPETPAEAAFADLRIFAAKLSKTTATLHLELSETSANLSKQVADAKDRLGEQAAAFRGVDGFDAAADLTAPEALHPLVEARATAKRKAESQRDVQGAAEAQVKPAGDLDFAISAGAARRAALDILSSELVDAKFLNHLTALNTRTLLGVASDLFGELSDERFGFADGFEIVSRGSGAVHSPNRLSGGEKFLASLALALALAEMHSVTGPRLGSLFLDEGFATLDFTALQSALDVLRGKASDDRLVMVISHLHAVAEAVDDVLWVERGVTGSEARWLTADQRDELLQTDLTSRLQRQA